MDKLLWNQIESEAEKSYPISNGKPGHFTDTEWQTFLSKRLEHISAIESGVRIGRNFLLSNDEKLAVWAIQDIDLITDYADFDARVKLKMIEDRIQNFWKKYPSPSSREQPLREDLERFINDFVVGKELKHEIACLVTAYMATVGIDVSDEQQQQFQDKHSGDLIDSVLDTLLVSLAARTALAGEWDGWISIEKNGQPEKSGYYICWCGNEPGSIHYHVDTGWQNRFYNDKVTHYKILTPPQTK